LVEVVVVPFPGAGLIGVGKGVTSPALVVVVVVAFCLVVVVVDLKQVCSHFHNTFLLVLSKKHCPVAVLQP
jgi:hypothetical protein